MVTIIVNNKEIIIKDGCNIRIENGNVYSNNVEVGNFDEHYPEIVINGKCGSIDCKGSVRVEGDVIGDIDCNTCWCKNVTGDVDANTVWANNVGGKIDANSVWMGHER